LQPGINVRVLSVISAYPSSIGGAQLHAHELNQALQRCGIDVTVATLWRESRTDWLRGSTVAAPSPQPVSRLDGISVEVVGLTPGERRAAALPALTYYSSMRRARPRLTRLFQQQAEVAIERSRPDVAHLSRIGREWWYQAFLEVLGARGVPFVITPNHHAHWGTRARDWWWNEIYRAAGAVLVLSDHEADTVARLGVPRDRIIRTVVGVVGGPTEESSTERATDDRHPVVLFLGQVKTYKGLDRLYEAMVGHVWPEHATARLVVVGPWVDRLQRLRRRLEADDRVDVLGPVDEVTKWTQLRRASVLCMPSTEEALGGVYVEAWSVGCPAIGADIPPVRELFERARTGLVVAPEPPAIGRALASLLSDPDRSEALGAAGAVAVGEEYNWDVAAQRAAAAYELVLSRA
jgi:glycosyltransferase involved in cell wall biosynthesis